MRLRRSVTLALVPLAALLAIDEARANERHFTFTYESAVLPRGGKELEIWSTPRIGRGDYYSRFDQRAELEVGVTDRLQTALYLNFTAVTAAVPGTDELASEFSFGGVSSEWKYKLLDPVADALGLALYGEVTGSTDELELEAKLILDKQIGRTLIAANLVAEQEWEFEADETHRETILELDLAIAWRITAGFTAGIEVRNHNEIVEDEGFEHSALFAGPVISYATEEWWIALTVMPQLPALYHHDGDTTVLDEHEKVNARLLFSFHL
jgi:hypothetical protein